MRNIMLLLLLLLLRCISFFLSLNGFINNNKPIAVNTVMDARVTIQPACATNRRAHYKLNRPNRPTLYITNDNDV